MKNTILAAHVDAIRRYQHGIKWLADIDKERVACDVELSNITTPYLIELLKKYPSHTFENDCILYDRPLT
jgi:hypothetical protein